jgi:signal transduction histidine kinase
MWTLFLAYTNEIQAIEQKWSLSPEKLRAVLDVSNLSPEKQDEYKEVVAELTTISTSLKNISENPELYIQSWGSKETQITEGNYKISVSWLVTRPESAFATMSAFFAHPLLWDRDTPEWRLVIWLINRILITDLIFLLLITSLYFLWIRRVFIPVHTIIDRLNAYIDRAKFQTITYRRNDEFAPLVSTINNLYKSLRVQENIRSNFLSDISHEIRTPITAVKCYLEAIEDGMMLLDTKTIPLLQNELTRLTSITEKIMEYETLTHHYTDDIHIERFILHDQIEILIHEYLPQIEKNAQKISIEWVNDVYIRMDKNMLIQILHNVFSNFIKYAGNNTELICSYIRKKDQIEILFNDNGIGIPEAEISMVLEKFYRIDKSRTRDTQMSMGIGLSIIDHIVRIHDGSLTIHNNKPNWLSLTLIFPR